MTELEKNLSNGFFSRQKMDSPVARNIFTELGGEFCMRVQLCSFMSLLTVFFWEEIKHPGYDGVAPFFPVVKQLLPPHFSTLVSKHLR
jgi:hypothetical protein